MQKDALGRLIVTRDLSIPGYAQQFAVGDEACAQLDDAGNTTLITCQHGRPMGKVAGYNAVSGLLGKPLVDYQQPHYVTILDLGAWGALCTDGWQHEVKLTHEQGKRVKRYINHERITPPHNISREGLFALAGIDAQQPIQWENML